MYSFDGIIIIYETLTIECYLNITVDNLILKKSDSLIT